MMYAYYKNEVLRSHPGPIIMIVMLADQFSYWGFMMFNRLCELRLPELFSYTVYFSNTPQDVTRATYVLVNAINWLSVLFCYNFCTVMMMFLAIDLYLILKYPLVPKSSRYKWYIAITLIISSSFSISMEILFVHRERSSSIIFF